MDQADKLNQWIQVLGNDLGLDLYPDENNIATLTFGRDLCISIAPSLSCNSHFVIAGPVLMLTQDPEIDYPIYKKALKSAFMGDHTWGGILGIDEGGGLILGHTIPYEGCDEIIFNNIVHNFAQALQDLHDRLSDRMDSFAGFRGTEFPANGVMDFV